MKWVITWSSVDLDSRKRIGLGNATPEEAERFPHRWRTRDGDGEISFCGKSDSIGFAPLDDFCRDETGDVEIEFKGPDGKYVPL